MSAVGQGGAPGAEQRRAVVVGASMAGLCVARALADTFDAVTVLDRDRLPTGPTARAGVPQGRHVHVLLPPGAHALGELFPGLLDELTADGAGTVPTERIRGCLNGHRLAPGPTGHAELAASRPLIEAGVRRQLEVEPSVELRDGTEVRGLATDRTGRRIVGVRTRPRDGDGPEQTVAGDLVVDCSGRRSATPDWLAELGYDPPAVEQLDVGVRYATRHYRLPPDVLDGDRHVLVGPTASVAAGGVLLAIENDRWVTTLFGLGDMRPSLDPEGFEPYAARLPVRDLHDALREGRPLDEPTGFRFPANRRRRYERLDRFPEGLLVAGDAVCSFNPIYGQGMTVAAIEAMLLRRLLLEEGVPTAQRWFATIAPTVETAWELTVGADLAIDAVPGHRSVEDRLQHAYLRAYHAAARHDPALTAQFWRVVGLIDPPTTLLRPSIVARVLRGRLRRVRSQPNGPARSAGEAGTEPSPSP